MDYEGEGKGDQNYVVMKEVVLESKVRGMGWMSGRGSERCGGRAWWIQSERKGSMEEKRGRGGGRKEGVEEHVREGRKRVCVWWRRM